MLKRLELVIPPGLLVVLMLPIIWFADWLNLVPLAALSLSDELRWLLAALLLIVSTTLLVLSSARFLRAKTTLDPRIPEQSSQLVTSGVYRFSRNPIYLGFTALLLCWSFYLNSAIGLLLSLGFASYLQWLQIIPEERFLNEKFGDPYRRYCQQVRRWL